MNDKLIRSSLKISIMLGVILTLYFLQYGLAVGLSVAGGVLFSVLNLYFLWKLIQEIVTTGPRSKTNIAGVMFLKFVILWGTFIAVMAFGWASPLHLAIGFSVFLFVLSMKGFGRWIIDYFGMGPGKGLGLDKELDPDKPDNKSD
jgi:hypothetical protein